jgi:hypothetical protein
MGVANVPSAAGGGIKLVQRGSAGSAGTVTITAVNVDKAFVNVFGTASSGTVAGSGSVSAHTGNFPQTVMGLAADYYSNTGSGERPYGSTNSSGGAPSGINTNQSPAVIPSRTLNLDAANITGGSNNLVAAVVQGYLSGSTSLVVSGACRWEVVEFA